MDTEQALEPIDDPIHDIFDEFRYCRKSLQKSFAQPEYQLYAGFYELRYSANQASNNIGNDRWRVFKQQGGPLWISPLSAR